MTGGTSTITTSVTLEAQHQTVGAAAPATFSTTQRQVQSLAFGSGSNTFNTGVAFTRYLAPGASETLDLYAGLTEPIGGVTAAFRLVRAFALWVASGGDAAGVTVAGGASNPFTFTLGGTTPTNTVYPSGAAFSGGCPAGTAVTSTARNVLVTNNGAAAVGYTLFVEGSLYTAGEPMGLLLALTSA